MISHYIKNQKREDALINKQRCICSMGVKTTKQVGRSTCVPVCGFKQLVCTSGNTSIRFQQQRQNSRKPANRSHWLSTRDAHPPVFAQAKHYSSVIYYRPLTTRFLWLARGPHHYPNNNFTEWMPCVFYYWGIFRHIVNGKGCAPSELLSSMFLSLDVSVFKASK